MPFAAARTPLERQNSALG